MKLYSSLTPLRIFQLAYICMNRLPIVMVWALMLVACSTTPRYEPDSTALAVSRVCIDLDDTAKVQQILNQQYEEWRSVRHLMGGTSMKGIECSGLVYQTYRTKLGIEVPRSTDHQSKLGRAIRKDQLRAGDLVFFHNRDFLAPRWHVY